MNVVHVVGSIEHEAAGPSYSVPRLCEQLAQLRHNVTLSSLGSGRAISGVRLRNYSAWPFVGRLGLSPTQLYSLRQSATLADVVHNHGLWMTANVAVGLLVPGQRAKLVMSPRGMLSPWAVDHHGTRKRLIWPLQRRAVERAELLHATSDLEFAELREMHLKAPVTVVPNGIDIPARPNQRRSHTGRTLLFLGRLHPVKGIEVLLAAWRDVQTTNRDWELVIAGSGESRYERELRETAARLGVQRVQFSGPVYGDSKSDLYFSADLFVLPSYTENFGMVVAEALAHECPAIVSRHAPWQELETEGCGWWTDNRPVDLAAVLDSAMKLPPLELTAMGERGRAWMERSFSWDSVARQMEASYLWVLGGGHPPDVVRVN